MTVRTRQVVFLIFGVVVFGLFSWAVLGLVPFGKFEGAYGLLLNAATIPLRHVTNVPTAINYDFRGVDTMGEEYILFAAVIGTTTLLRQMRREMEEAEETEDVGKQRQPSDAVRLVGLIVTGLLVLFGIYVILHGHMTPGGGFQGGVILGTAAPMIYMAAEYDTYAKLSPVALMEFGHGVGAAAYVAIGLLGVIVGQVFLANVLPLGSAGHFLSGGTIPLINDTVGFEVAIGFATIYREFLLQTRRSGE
jgi:multicomponent Na+:H+ antiporter subunit B